MAVVPLKFIPPVEDNIVALRIYEAATKDGPFNQIERTTAIGTAPNYIDEYETTLAASGTDWFTIAWEDDKGFTSPLSQPVQGGTDTLVGILVARIMLRDSTINEIIAAQEAEAAISEYFGVDDPFSISAASVSPRILSGLTSLALARSYITKAITSTTTANAKWTAGIVSMDNSQSSSSSSNLTDTVKSLLEIANRDLGRNYSVILLMEEIQVAGGFRQIVAADLSRSIIEVQ